MLFFVIFALHGCELLREGGNHSWWHNPSQNKRSAIPRHNEIKEILAKKICKDLGVPSPDYNANCLQINRHKLFFISLWRGTGAFLPLAGF